MSASTWHGWYSFVRPLITGTREFSAKRWMMSCSNVRIMMMSTIREITCAESSTGSPRPSCVSRVLMNTAWPPSWKIPASNDRRVRVELFSKIIASVRSCSG